MGLKKSSPTGLNLPKTRRSWKRSQSLVLQKQGPSVNQIRGREEQRLHFGATCMVVDSTTCLSVERESALLAHRKFGC